MQFSTEGANWLKRIEKLALKPYDDQTGRPITSYVKGATIGYGHLITSPAEFAKYKAGITTEGANQLFATDLQPFVQAANRVASRAFVPLSQNQFDALVILAFNLGVPQFEGSTVVKMLINPCGKYAYPSLEKAWKAWNKSQGRVNQGLINRRDAEWDMFAKGVYRFW